ncbi:MAG: hypothetical protein PHS30_07125 [Bacteroidales bacterium]|nr:hypothetical protein [Bacteroidales bacterium]
MSCSNDEETVQDLRISFLGNTSIIVNSSDTIDYLTLSAGVSTYSFSIAAFADHGISASLSSLKRIDNIDEDTTTIANFTSNTVHSSGLPIFHDAAPALGYTVSGTFTNDSIATYVVTIIDKSTTPKRISRRIVVSKD